MATSKKAPGPAQCLPSPIARAPAAPATQAEPSQLTYDYLVCMLLEKSETLAHNVNELTERLSRVAEPEHLEPVTSISDPGIAEALLPLAAIVDKFECMIQRVQHLQRRLQI